MRQRGRPSAAAKAVIITGDFGRRAEPPPELTERQAEIWRETVASEPPDLFATAACRGILADFCRHRESAENVSAVIDTFKPEWLKNSEGVKRYQALLRMRESETRNTVNTARALRLTNQSRYRPDRADVAGRNAAKGPKPWEV